MKKDLTISELKLRLDGVPRPRLIDVRNPDEFASGHIPGAENHPLGQLDTAIPGVEPTEDVLVVCHSGMRSNQACQKLADRYPRLYNVLGGTAAWIAAGHPIQR